MNLPALTKDNSTTIGFVVACLFAGAINKRELRTWTDHIFASTDSQPKYLIDLCTFDGLLSHIFGVIGFVPHCDLSESEKDALVGIAYVRGHSRFEPEPTREQALSSLRRHPEVLARFRMTFPFIEFQYNHAA
ncbi:MAG TPA: hypothetical protein VGY98_07805 [Verrucomicrobiae bacterium]|nr:hypothetical protein [Verrucomicrobiae bacterium]